MTAHESNAKAKSDNTMDGAPRATRELYPEYSFVDLFGNFAVATGIIDAKGNLLQANAAFCALLGYRDSEINGLNVNVIVHPDDFIVDFDEFERREAAPIEQRLLTSTGNLLTGIVSASLFQAADGSKKYFFQIQDVTDYRLTLERLREQQAMLNAISENSTDAIFLKDRKPVCL